MCQKRYSRRHLGRYWLAALAALALAGAGRAQSAAPTDPGAAPAPIFDPNVVQAGCATCGGGGLPPLSCQGSCALGACGGGVGQCSPGRNTCFCGDWQADTAFGRFLNGVYNCICCPDPCYEPRWTPVADAAFFVDAARPVTQTRLRYEHDWNIHTPDRGEYFWAAPRLPSVIGPGGMCALHGVGKNMNCIPDSVDTDELFVYTEAGTGRFSAFVEMSYLSLDPHASAAIPTVAPPGTTLADPITPCCHESGFGDMNVGTKAMIIDCCLMQLTFQFKTYLPTGAFTKGLGTGHVSLEPSLLLGLNLSPNCYLQAQTSYWIPIGGDDLYQANVYHNHISLNHVLWRPCPGLTLVGTLEANDWWFLNGSYTETGFLAPIPGTTPPSLAAVAGPASGSNIFTFGPGVRLFVCDKIDVGVGSAFAVGGNRWADELIRAEFRMRF